MRSLTRRSVQQLMLLTFITTPILASDSINLTQFQKISGFSADCTKAYGSSIPGCTANDFIHNNPCSQACIMGLQQLTSLLNSACSGTSTSPDTLIGLFFEGKGVQALCPSVAISTAPSSTIQQTSGTSQATSTAPASSSAAPTSTTATIITSSQQDTLTTSSSTSTFASSIQPTAPVPSFTLSLASTSTAAQTSSTGTTPFGGQINPFSSSDAPSDDSLCRTLAMTVLVAVGLFIW